MYIKNENTRVRKDRRAGVDRPGVREIRGWKVDAAAVVRRPRLSALRRSHTAHFSPRLNTSSLPGSLRVLHVPIERAPEPWKASLCGGAKRAPRFASVSVINQCARFPCPTEFIDAIVFLERSANRTLPLGLSANRLPLQGKS